MCAGSASSALQSARAAHYSLWQACHGLVSPRLMLAHLWPLQLGHCICLVTCLGPLHSCLLCRLSLKSSPGSAKTEARELKVQCMSRTHNLNAVRAARVRSATSVRGSKRTRGKEQAPMHASSQLHPNDPRPFRGLLQGSRSSILLSLRLWLPLLPVLRMGLARMWRLWYRTG